MKPWLYALSCILFFCPAFSYAIACFNSQNIFPCDALVLFEKGNVSAISLHNQAALNRLSRMAGVKQILPDRMIYAPAKLDSKSFKNKASATQITPAGIKRIGATPGKLLFDGEGIGVAVVDTGLDMNHRDLNVSPTCFAGRFSSCMDDNGHGTHVAGIIGALDNNLDVVGVAPKTTLYAVKVLDGAGIGKDSDLIAGLEWVAQHAKSVEPNIRVINISLGRKGALVDNPILHALIKKLTNLEIAVVVSAGNHENFEITQMVPASYPEIITVASTTAQEGTNLCKFFPENILADTASFFTTDGAAVTISAPGAKQENINEQCYVESVGIPSLKVGGGIAYASGSDFAAAHVSGVVALLIQQDQTRTPYEIRSIIQQTAERKGEAPLDSFIKQYTFDGEREGIISTSNLSD